MRENMGRAKKNKESILFLLFIFFFKIEGWPPRDYCQRIVAMASGSDGGNYGQSAKI